MFDKVRALFAPTPPATDMRLPTNDTLWADGLQFPGRQFPKWDRESLRSWKGHQIYDDMMRDEQVKAVVQFRRRSISGRDWFFAYTDDQIEELGEDEAKMRVDLFTWLVSNMPGTFSTRMDQILTAMYTGYSINEKVYGPAEWQGKTWWCIKRIAKKPYWTFEPIVDEYGNVVEMWQSVNGKRIKVDPRRVIYYVQNPDYDEQFGQSELEAAYNAWFSKTMINRFWDIWMERMAGGFNVLTPRAGASRTLRAGTPEYNNMQAILKNLATATGIILPEGFDLDSHMPGNTDAFERSIASKDKAIAKALLVPNLIGISEQGSTGSYAQSQTQLEAFLWMLESDAGKLEECLNEQLFAELGNANFGDGVYPRFTFAGLSQAMKAQTIQTWNALVQSGAVTASPTDEQYVRNLLGFPAQAEVDEGGDAVRQETALNGAQIASLVDIISKVHSGELSGDSAIQVIVSSFPIPLEKATEMVESNAPDDDAAPVLPQPIPPGGVPGKEGEAVMPGGEGMDDDDLPDETIVGKDQANIVHKHREPTNAFTKAARRVDFAVIDSNATTLEWEATDRLADAMDKAVLSIVAKVESDPALSGADADPEAIAMLGPQTSDVAAVRKALADEMRKSWDLGEQHANREMRKAGFARRKGMFAAIGDKAASYINAKSITGAGKMTEDMKALVANVLFNSIKFSWTQAQTIKKIYDELTTAGLISQSLAEQELGNAIGARNPTSRLETTVRTTSFDAINEARLSFFSDPALGGFVNGLEYAAILDGRTTEICQQLDEQKHEIGDAFWNQYRPPNHFNCRSLLIALTTDDEWEETPTDDITATPAAGFGFSRIDQAPPMPAITVNLTVPDGAFNIQMPKPDPVVVNVPPANVTVNVPKNKGAEFTGKGKQTRTVSLDVGGRQVTGTITTGADE